MTRPLQSFKSTLIVIGVDLNIIETTNLSHQRTLFQIVEFKLTLTYTTIFLRLSYNISLETPGALTHQLHTYTVHLQFRMQVPDCVTPVTSFLAEAAALYPIKSGAIQSEPGWLPPASRRFHNWAPHC